MCRGFLLSLLAREIIRAYQKFVIDTWILWLPVCKSIGRLEKLELMCLVNVSGAGGKYLEGYLEVYIFRSPPLNAMIDCIALSGAV